MPPFGLVSRKNQRYHDSVAKQAFVIGVLPCDVGYQLCLEKNYPKIIIFLICYRKFTSNSIQNPR